MLTAREIKEWLEDKADRSEPEKGKRTGDGKKRLGRDILLAVVSSLASLLFLVLLWSTLSLILSNLLPTFLLVLVIAVAVFLLLRN